MKSEITNDPGSSSFKPSVQNVIANCSRTLVGTSNPSVDELNKDFYRIKGDEEVKIFALENRLQIHHQRLVEGLASQFRKQAFCDVVLKVGSSIPYFANIFNTEESKSQPLKNEEAEQRYEESDRSWSWRNPLLINIDSFQANIESSYFQHLVRGFVNFLYSGEISLSQQNVEDFKNLAAKFECELLFNEINHFKETVFNPPSPLIDLPDDYVAKEGLAVNSEPSFKLVDDKKSSTTKKAKSRKLSAEGTKTSTKVSKKPKSQKSCENTQVENQKSENCCARCGLMFSSLKELKEHRKAHFTKSFVCVTCGDAYYHIMEMLKHLDDWKHGETKCSVCGHDSKSQSNLIKHLDKHREPGKPYYCTECDQRFKCKRDLTMHTPKHSKTASFVCPVCEKGFKWKHALVAHMVTHSADQKFLCSDCGFSTKHQTSFAAHQRQHTGKTYTCSVQGCEFQTIRKQSLKQHAKTHTKEKPHQCEICGQAFSLAKNMKRHSQLHDLNAMPESCPALTTKGCSFKSFRKDKMSMHVSKNHPWLEENANETDGERQKRILEDVAFTNPMSMRNPPNTIVTQSLATLPMSPPVMSASVFGRDGTTNLSNSTISSIQVMMPTGTLHYSQS